MDDITHPQRFARALAGFDPSRPILVLAHNDADGLSAGAIFKRSFDRLARPAAIRIVGRGENPWSEEMRAELAAQELGGLIVADLGLRPGPLMPGVSTIVVDHHVPAGQPAPEVTAVSGYGLDPVPTTSLLAYRCAAVLTDVSDWLWLAAIGIVGDLGDKAPFEELAAAKARYTASAIRETVSLVNAPRRSAAGDAAPALKLLTKAATPRDAISGAYPETALLQAARDEVKRALETGKRVAPKVRGEVALILLDSPCQIHPLVAQAWRLRLRDKIVIAANTGFRPGWVHFAVRSSGGRNLIAYLREVAPPDADENYGSGHEQATGGALRLGDWEIFLSRIGFAAMTGVAA